MYELLGNLSEVRPPITQPLHERSAKKVQVIKLRDRIICK